MDIKAKIEEFVEKIKGDKDLMKNFKEEPVKTVEKLLGVDLPDEQIEKLVDGIKAKLKLDDVTDKIEGLGDKLEGALGGLFGKKK